MVLKKDTIENVIKYIQHFGKFIKHLYIHYITGDTGKSYLTERYNTGRVINSVNIN